MTALVQIVRAFRAREGVEVAGRGRAVFLPPWPVRVKVACAQQTFALHGQVRDAHLKGTSAGVT